MPRKTLQDGQSRMTGIYLENFQSIRRPTYLDCRGLTFLYGPNSAGKSSIIDVLKLLHTFSDLDSDKSFSWQLHQASPPSKKGSQYIQPVIGLDYLQGETWSPGATSTQKRWAAQHVEGSISETSHIDFHEALQGKRLGIRLSDERMSVFVEGEELFRIQDSDVLLDQLHRPTSNIRTADKTLLEGSQEIRINKRHPYSKLLDVPLDLFSKESARLDAKLANSYHWPALVSES